MVNIQFVFQTYKHTEPNTVIQILSGSDLVLSKEIQSNTIASFTCQLRIPTTIKIVAQGARVMVKRVSINNFTIDNYGLFPQLVNNQSDNYQVHLHNTEIHFIIDDDNPTRWLMRNKNEILIDRTADGKQDKVYSYE
jgi:hypothetical protein